MTYRYAAPRYFVALALPLLAATLACSALGGAGGAPNAVLTQAAATLSAAAAQVATAQAGLTTGVAGTSAPQPTQAATAAPAGVATQTPAPGGAAAVDPCKLVTTDEAQSLTVVPVDSPMPENNGCLFAVKSNGTAGVGVYALPPADGSDFLQQYLPTLEQGGVTLDQTKVDQVDQARAAGDMPAAVNALFALSTGLPGYDVQKLDGVGSAALWSWHPFSGDHDAAAFAAKPGALVVLIAIAAPAIKEADLQTNMATIVKRILANLPDTFTVAGSP